MIRASIVLAFLTFWLGCATSNSDALIELATLKAERGACDGSWSAYVISETQRLLAQSSSLDDYHKRLGPLLISHTKVVALIRAVDTAVELALLRLQMRTPGDHVDPVRKLVCSLSAIVRGHGLPVALPGRGTQRCDL